MIALGTLVLPRRHTPRSSPSCATPTARRSSRTPSRRSCASKSAEGSIVNTLRSAPSSPRARLRCALRVQGHPCCPHRIAAVELGRHNVRGTPRAPEPPGPAWRPRTGTSSPRAASSHPTSPSSPAATRCSAGSSHPAQAIPRTPRGCDGCRSAAPCGRAVEGSSGRVPCRVEAARARPVLRR